MRRFLFLLLMVFFALHSYANTFPDKPIKIVYGIGAGSQHWIIFNTIADSIPDKKITFGHEFRPGAGNAIAQQYVKQSRPDGYTLLFTTPSVIINPILNPSLNFNALTDFEPIIFIGFQESVIVTNSSTPFTNVRDMINYSIKNPNALTFGHNGHGTQSYIAIKQLFEKGLLIDVPYKASTFILNDLLGGHIDFAMIPVGALYGLNNSRIRLLATTGLRRNTTLNLPTVNDQVKGFESVIWYGVMAPRGLDPNVKKTLHDIISSGINTTSINTLQKQGITIQNRDFGPVLKSEQAKWINILKGQ